MAKINQVMQYVEKIAPKSWAETWDNPGLLIGDGAAEVNKVLITLDVTSAVAKEAEEMGAQMVLAHHPLIFRPLNNLRDDNGSAKVPLQLIRKNIACYAAHTNLDQSRLSSSQTLGRALELESMDVFAPAYESMVKLQVFVPVAQAEEVRQALSKAGVGENVSDQGEEDRYAECFFHSQGEGTFLPLPGAHPAVGEIGNLSRVEEIKLESILPEKGIEKAIRAMRRAHPYEEPAYDIIPLGNKGRKRGYGTVGYLAEPLKLSSFKEKFLQMLKANRDGGVQQIFPYDGYDLSGIRFAGHADKIIRKIAILNGSGSSYVGKGLMQGIDLFISGDIDHHAALDALEGGMAVCDMGHFLSEVPMLASMLDYLKENKEFKDIEFFISRKNQVPYGLNWF